MVITEMDCILISNRTWLLDVQFNGEIGAWLLMIFVYCFKWFNKTLWLLVSLTTTSTYRVIEQWNKRVCFETKNVCSSRWTRTSCEWSLEPSQLLHVTNDIMSLSYKVAQKQMSFAPDSDLFTNILQLK